MREGLDYVLVRVSPELVAQMESEWSDPVRVKLEKQDDGTYELIAKSLSRPEGDERG